MTAPGKLIYVTYASGPFERNLPINGWFARHFLRADQVLLYRRADLEADPVYAANRAIFDAPRGAGFYAWKAWYIWKALDQAGPNDVVLYHDCGTGLRYKSLLHPRELIALARREGFVSGVRCPQYGPNRLWNRRLCLARMDADRPDILSADTIETSISLWTNTQKSREFLMQWRDYCLVHDVIRDARPDELPSEDPDFIQHRYDQAVMTNLVWRDAAPWVDCHADGLEFAKSVTLLELDLRGRKSRVYRVLWRVVVAAARLRKRWRTML
jgi:hypothetical protein